jgi:hypothetical protein
MIREEPLILASGSLLFHNYSLNPINKAICQPLNFVLARKLLRLGDCGFLKLGLLSQLSFAKTDKQRLTDFV